MKRALVAGVFAVAAVCGAQGKDGALEVSVAKIVESHHGKVALYAAELGSGFSVAQSIAHDADVPVQTASTIKLAMLWEAARQVAQGQASWDEKIVLTKDQQVGGSGVLHFLSAPVTITLKDAATFMVIVSDNTATNLMIDRFTTKAVNEDMAALGLEQTVLYKKVFKPATGPMPADQPKFGLGKTTPRQMATLMEKIGRCDLNVPGRPKVDPAKADSACVEAMNMLRNQFYRETIPRYLESLDATETGSGIASKTGSLDASRSDVAIVAGKNGPIILAIYTYENNDHGWTVDNEGEMTIAKIAQAVVKAWSPQGIDGKTLVPGLGLRK